MQYLSQECQVLNNQVSTLCFPSTTFPTDDDTLKQNENNVVTKDIKWWAILYIFPYVSKEKFKILLLFQVKSGYLAGMFK